MKIITAQIEDVEAILKLQKVAYFNDTPLYYDTTQSPFHQTLDEIKQEFRDFTFLKAVDKKLLVGSVRAYLNQDTCLIKHLIVHPLFRGRGIGTTLMYTIEKVFSDAQRYELYADGNNQHVLCLFQMLGYQIFKTKLFRDQFPLVYMEKMAYTS